MSKTKKMTYDQFTVASAFVVTWNSSTGWDISLGGGSDDDYKGTLKWTQGHGTVHHVKDADLKFGRGYTPVKFNFSDGANNILGSRVGDEITGGHGSDFIRTGSGNDKAFGGRGILDPIGDGDDVIDLGDGDDEGYGNSGNDNISGGNGNDKLFGGNGNDSLFGGSGADLLIGGAGADRFVFLKDTDSGVVQPGNKGAIDTALDFNPGEQDRFDFTALDARVHSKGNNSFTFIGNFYDGPVALEEGQAAAEHTKEGTYIHIWDGDESGVSLRLFLKDFHQNIHASDLIL